MDLSVAMDLVVRFEGFRSKPYLCPAGIPSIGFGSTYYGDGRAVTLTDPSISQDAARILTEAELRRQCLPAVLRFCPGLTNDAQTANALADFCYNLGPGRLQTSTLRRKVNDQNWLGAREQIRKWVYSGGKVLPGLVLRREAEAAIMPLGA